jgi:hypothetical protein
MSRLKEIKSRIDAASPGPWRALAGARKVSVRDVGLGALPATFATPLVLGNDEYVIGEISPWMEDGDRDFIAHSRTDVEHLYDELRAVRGLLRDVLTRVPGADYAADAYLNDPEKTT